MPSKIAMVYAVTGSINIGSIKMKVAVCLSGQPRYFRECSPYLLRSLENLDVDFFIHSWYHENMVNDELKPQSKDGDRRGWVVEKETDRGLLETYMPKAFKFEEQKKFIPKFDFSKRTSYWGPPEYLISSFYSNKQVGKLLHDYVDNTNTNYDLVISTRTDFAPVVNLADSFVGKNMQDIITAFVPGNDWNKKYMNDPFVASTYENMMHWFNNYDCFEDDWLAGIDFCPHRLRFHHMQKLETGFAEILSNAWYYYRENGLQTY